MPHNKNIQPITHGPKQHFFGFHDICPWDEDEKYILALEADFLDHPPRAGDKATIGIIDTANESSFKKIAETRAWNFQQGCRQQWLPGRKNTIIYNDREGDAFISKTLDIGTGETRSFPMATYAIHPSGNYGLGLNFARLNEYGGYGYRGGTFKEGEDGIWRIDFETGETELLISIKNIADQVGTETVNTEGHYLTHVTFNRSGTKIAFIHKWEMKDGGVRNKFITANADGTNAHAHPVQVTHYDWKNDKEILAFGRKREAITKLREKNVFANPIFRPLLWFVRKTRKGLRQHLVGDRYFLINETTKGVMPIGVGVLTEDGHPSFSPNENLVITDTYPDGKHYRTLILYNWETGGRKDLAKLYSLPNKSYNVENDWDISEMRSDFHPRWNRSGTKVCFDSVHEGDKQMYVITF
jgi:hypothetical protein